MRANFLASPPLVVAYAIAGTVDIDLTNDPLGTDREESRYTCDIWPRQDEIAELVAANVTQAQFREQYSDVFEGADAWKAVEVSGGDLYEWNGASTYIQEPPFFVDLAPQPPPITALRGAAGSLAARRLGHH